MGRYKSVLMAEKDARDFPHHVELPIPPYGLGKRLDVIATWLNRNIGPDWRSHSHLEKGEHTALYIHPRRMQRRQLVLYRPGLPGQELHHRRPTRGRRQLERAGLDGVACITQEFRLTYTR